MSALPYVYRISFGSPAAANAGVVASAADQARVAGMIEAVLQREGFKSRDEGATEWNKGGAVVTWNRDVTNGMTLSFATTGGKRSVRKADAVELELLRRLTAEPSAIVRRESAAMVPRSPATEVSSNVFPLTVRGTNAIPSARP